MICLLLLHYSWYGYTVYTHYSYAASLSGFPDVFYLGFHGVLWVWGICDSLQPETANQHSTILWWASLRRKVWVWV